MLNSGNTGTDHNTAAWTDFVQPVSCKSGANTNNTHDVMENSSSSGNPNPVLFGKEMTMHTGVATPLLTHQNKPNLYDCWQNNASLGNDGYGNPNKSWPLKLPVIDCPKNNVENCSTVLGVVKIELLWIVVDAKLKGSNAYDEAPYVMDDWSADTAADVSDVSIGEQRWKSFAKHFGIVELEDSQDDLYKSKTIYFKPLCEVVEPTGVKGGENFGILAKIPVIVD